MRGRVGLSLMLLAAGCVAEAPAVAAADPPVFTLAPMPSDTCEPLVKRRRDEAAVKAVGALVMIGLAAATRGNVGGPGPGGEPKRLAANGQRC